MSVARSLARVVHAAMRNKTDCNDASGIAQILRTGWYSRVHVKRVHSHPLRALLASGSCGEAVGYVRRTLNACSWSIDAQPLE
jgi:hypothetical protein